MYYEFKKYSSMSFVVDPHLLEGGEHAFPSLIFKKLGINTLNVYIMSLLNIYI